jgi:hypothetical protein
MRRSTTDARSWESLHILLDPDAHFDDYNKTGERYLTHYNGTVPNVPILRGGCAIWDPTPVLERHTCSGRVFVFFARSTNSVMGSPCPGRHKDV